MKKLLLTLAGVGMFHTPSAFAEKKFDTTQQAGEKLTLEVVGIGNANTSYTGMFGFAKQKIARRLALIEILFSEVEYDFHRKALVDNSTLLIAGAGIAYSREHANVGLMVTYVNDSPYVSLTPYAYVETKDGRLNMFTFVTVQLERIDFVFEGLYCTDIPGTKSKLGIGAMSFREYLGPYVRVSFGPMYIGFNYGWYILPEFKWGNGGSHEKSAIYHTQDPIGQIVIGLGLGEKRRCGNCN